MSFSFDSLSLRRKRTATERAENNGDPLVARKKAREAAKSNAVTPTLSPAATAKAPKNGSKVSSYF